MKVNNIQNTNQTNFGIKYVNKKAWNADVLSAFEKSKILEKIDEKYPNANVYYKKLSGEEDIVNGEMIHTLVMDIKLEKDKFFRWHLSSHFEKYPEKTLIRELKTLTMDDVESGSAEKLSPIMSITVYKQNPIKAFLKKLFS